MKDFEYLLNRVGGWGIFQKKLCILLAIAEISSGYLMMLISVTSETLQHRCYVPQVDKASGLSFVNSSVERFIPSRMFNKSFEYEECLQYKTPQMENSTSLNASTVPCQSGWVYDDTYEGKTTVVSEFSLVCDKAWIKPISSSSFMAGVLVGSLITGYFSDKFGRQIVLKITIIGRFVFTIITSFATNVIFYNACSFILGVGSLAFCIPVTVLAQEVCSKNRRFLVIMMLMLGFSCGYMIIPLVSYYVRDWRWFLRVLGISGLLYIPYLWLLPKSPLWLLSRSKYKEASQLLTEISKKNKSYNKEIKDMLTEENLKLIAKKVHQVEEAEEGMSYVDLFKGKLMPLRVLCISYLWFQASCVYYTFALHSVQMAGNPYLNNFLSGFGDIVGVCTTIPLSQVFGRVPINVAAFTLALLACLSMAVLYSSVPGAMIYISLVAKTAVSGVFGLIYLYTGEMFPTSTRNKSIGFSSAMARAGSVMSPYIIYLGTMKGEWVTYAIMGALGVFAVISSILLPETFNAVLPETTEQAVNLKRSNLFSCKRKAVAETNKNDDETDCML